MEFHLTLLIAVLHKEFQSFKMFKWQKLISPPSNYARRVQRTEKEEEEVEENWHIVQAVFCSCFFWTKGQSK